MFVLYMFVHSYILLISCQFHNVLFIILKYLGFHIRPHSQNIYQESVTGLGTIRLHFDAKTRLRPSRSPPNKKEKKFAIVARYLCLAFVTLLYKQYTVKQACYLIYLFCILSTRQEYRMPLVYIYHIYIWTSVQVAHRCRRMTARKA